jgi:C6 transcription factor Pro1
MDNGEKEKAVANGIKEIVKHTSRRKTTTQTSKPRESITRIAPKLTNGSLESSSVPVTKLQQATPPSDHGSSFEGAKEMQDGSTVSLLF